MLKETIEQHKGTTIQCRAMTSLCLCLSLAVSFVLVLPMLCRCLSLCQKIPRDSDTTTLRGKSPQKDSPPDLVLRPSQKDSERNNQCIFRSLTEMAAAPSSPFIFATTNQPTNRSADQQDRHHHHHRHRHQRIHTIRSWQ